MSFIFPGLETRSPATSSVHVSGTSLRRLGEQTNEAAVDTDTKVVLRKSRSVERSPTSASDRTGLTDAYQEEAGFNDSARVEHNSLQQELNELVQTNFHSLASNLVIFDYDDTILPTFSLACSQRHVLGNQLIDPEMIRDELDQLNQVVLFNLNNVIKVATLVIVTNASSEWLTQSCERYLPNVAAFFAEHNIRIISARDRFENSLLAQMHWKYFIFIDLIEELFIEHLKHGEAFTVCSIGDGAEEREACLKLASIFKDQKWVFKNLKLLTQPTISYLIQQHVLLSKSFEGFFDLKTSADLCILFDKKKPEN